HLRIASYGFSITSPTSPVFSSIFLFTAPATLVIYTLSLHDALPIYSLFWITPVSTTLPSVILSPASSAGLFANRTAVFTNRRPGDRKSTRLNCSHVSISYAVFCLKKKRRLQQCP